MKNFSKTLKPFLTSRGCKSTDFITIEKDGEFIRITLTI